LFTLFPIYWTLITAIKPEGEIVQEVTYWPKEMTLDNFATSIEAIGFMQFFKNSAIVAFSTVGFIVIFAALVGYALSRFNFKGKRLFLLMMLGTQFMPGSLLLIPLFLLYQSFGVINSLSSLVFTYITFQLPFMSILMRGFVTNIPYELEEAAMVDGCSRMQTIFRIILPMLIPGIVAAAAFAFIRCWNEYIFALMFLSNQSKFTISVGLNYMMGQFNVNYGALAAASVIALSVPLVLFFYVQKYLVRGLGAGALKA
jgi:multiple sugar transport system permease protein